MWLFLVVALSIYAAMHGFVFWRVYAAWPRMGWWSLLLAMFFLLMIVGLVGVRLLEQAGHVRTARFMAAVSHSWIAIVFWLVCLLLVVQAWNLVVWLAHWAWVPAASAGLPPRPAMLGVLVVVAVAAAWSLVEARLVRHHELRVYTTALPAGHPGLLIAQISDVHLGADTGGYRLQRAIRIIESAQPDLLVATGDIVDAHYGDLKSYADMLAQVQPPLGKFAVTGNHEFYTGIRTAVDFHNAAGFRLLRQEAVEAGPYLRLAGVDDPAGAGWRNHSLMEEDPLLPPAHDGRFTVLLKHRPVIRQASLGRFDLQLSGHTHGGQIFPFGYFVRTRFDYFPGLHDLADGSRLYLSTGTGTWGPSMRLGAWPEVAFIRVLPARQ